MTKVYQLCLKEDDWDRLWDVMVVWLYDIVLRSWLAVQMWGFAVYWDAASGMSSTYRETECPVSLPSSS
ncbi:hypothetical protein OUZ56_016226 [Daphnia magna]|uniref:Uncharacterized protein n=1 Tax=Daphnia magna TaxID=35525 RepID=A0ABR0AQ49_9CRUS|nr:hypothetical protein OUZ56_016226 [Daphnia magna]